MRKMFLIGSVGTLLALGAVGGPATAANPNVPSSSPYTLVDIPSVGTPAPVLAETRAALVVANQPAGPPNGNVPSSSPYSLVPQAR
ncbi:MAG: hypothetical protein ACLQE9_16925 [Roseiarcus sp.]